MGFRHAGFERFGITAEIRIVVTEVRADVVVIGLVQLGLMRRVSETISRSLLCLMISSMVAA